MHDMEQTSLAMSLFLVGAFAWGAQGILGRGFYALGDTLTPSLIGSGLSLAWLPIYWFMAARFQHLGLAAASSMGIVLYCGVLLLVLFRRLRISVSGFVYFFLRTAMASVVAAGVALYLQRWLQEQVSWQTLGGSLLHIAFVGMVFLPIFLVIASRVGVASWRDLRALLVGRGRQ